jgi:predicted esterase
LLHLLAGVGVSVLGGGCTPEGNGFARQMPGLTQLLGGQDQAIDRLQSRPAANASRHAPAAGLVALGLDDARDPLLYIPRDYDPNAPGPLVVSLHGAGGDAEGGLYPLQPLADEHQFLLLAVPSRGRTWDAVLGRFGPDVAFIDQALAWTFARFAVDASSVAVSGFSDGASYALSLGLANGDLFGHVVAFSPGFVPRFTARGQPRIFVSHGTSDTVLPIDQCSRRIVPLLRQAEYEVSYEEFDGPHTVPPEIAESAAGWLLDTRGGTGDM